MGQGAHWGGAELVNLEKEGKLVPVDQVETTWLRTLMFLRTKLLALPSKLAARLSLCTGIVERQKVLREAIDELLVDLLPPRSSSVYRCRQAPTPREF